MKMNKKKVFIASLAVCLIAILSMGTLAWFNATDSVTNKFYVADSNGDGAPDFSINVYEQKVDENGDPVTDDNGNPVYTEEGNTYKDILPGSKLAKFVAVQNTGDYDQWVRINVTFSDSAVWQQAIAKAVVAEGKELTDETFDNYVFKTLLTSFVSWDCEDTYVRSFNIYGEDTMTYTLYYKKVVTPGDRITIMKQINIPGVLTQDDMNFGTGEDAGFTLTIMAEAVQTENLAATKASEAFAEVGWGVGTSYGA